MEIQKIVNLFNSSENEYSKFATKKWYIVDSETKGNYSHLDPIKFFTKSIESSLCDYSDGYILVTGDITGTRTIATNVAANPPIPKEKQPLDAATQAALKNCGPFKDCRTEINDTFVDYADLINIAMPMYNLIEYSDNYSDSSGSLWSFKRDEVIDNEDVTNDNNAPSFKYKESLVADNKADGTKNGVEIAVPLKYLSNFWRSLETPLINCKVELSLKWIQNCVLTTSANANKATFKIPNAKVYVLVVTLSTEDNAKLTKQRSEGFKRPVY